MTWARKARGENGSTGKLGVLRRNRKYKSETYFNQEILIEQKLCLRQVDKTFRRFVELTTESQADYVMREDSTFVIYELAGASCYSAKKYIFNGNHTDENREQLKKLFGMFSTQIPHGEVPKRLRKINSDNT